jgi:lysyl-tRNA synthetase class 2
MLEVYQAYSDYRGMMTLHQGHASLDCAATCIGATEIKHAASGQEINFAASGAR